MPFFREPAASTVTYEEFFRRMRDANGSRQKHK